MLGKPKFKYGDHVSFTCAGKTLEGTVYIIDPYGTFEDSSDVSYDVLVESEPTGCLYKHLREDTLTSITTE